jgi:hypothetical protein
MDPEGPAPARSLRSAESAARASLRSRTSSCARPPPAKRQRSRQSGGGPACQPRSGAAVRPPEPRRGPGTGGPPAPPGSVCRRHLRTGTARAGRMSGAVAAEAALANTIDPNATCFGRRRPTVRRDPSIDAISFEGEGVRAHPCASCACWGHAVGAAARPRRGMPQASQVNSQVEFASGLRRARAATLGGAQRTTCFDFIAARRSLRHRATHLARCLMQNQARSLSPKDPVPSPGCRSRHGRRERFA